MQIEILAEFDDMWVIDVWDFVWWVLMIFFPWWIGMILMKFYGLNDEQNRVFEVSNVLKRFDEEKIW